MKSPPNEVEFVSHRNPINSEEGAVKVTRIALESSTALASAFMASGFGQEIVIHSFFERTFMPCPQGTFSNSSSKGKEGCIKCPPGMY